MRNLGNVERAIRVVLGIVLIAVGYTADLSQVATVIVYLVGAIALVTGLAGYCPAWQLFGINTCPVKALGK
jgi:uncharacterized membrane protein HdeD (DUF308 family)